MNAPSPYTVLLLAGLAVSYFTWTRLSRRDARLPAVYLGALLGAFTGAKLVYLAAEGWMFWRAPDRWFIWATGKTILGALLGGYAGVELAKKAVGYVAPTGDLFALVAPIGIVLGRVGCLLHGCCPGLECTADWWALRDAAGVPRWPAVPVEIAFNLVALAVFLMLRAEGGKGKVEGIHAREPSTFDPRPSTLQGQHFHLYLIAYGAFRFAHEFLRATPRVALGLTGYQVAALACVALGAWGFWSRAKTSRR